MKVFIIMFLIIPIFLASAQDSLSVVSSTTWLTALADLAGAKNIHTLAPADLQHPPEYELTAQDVSRLYKADLILFAGYEVMAKRIQEGLNLPAKRLLQLDTRNDFPTVQASVRRIAQHLGTVEVAERNLAELELLYKRIAEWAIDAGLNDMNVAIQFHHQAYAKVFQVHPDLIFGPAPLNPQDMKEARDKQIELIIDNFHNPLATVLLDVLDNVKRVEFMNFPGKNGTKSLEDVLHYNWQELKTVFPSVQ